MQKLQNNYNKSIKLGHTDTITLERVCDSDGKGKVFSNGSIINQTLFC
ncbi:hypothetical protein DF16_pBMB400orf00206 (plasmid) [Bacillus thuringiensis serovar kurstaki str. YBT-1520]|nr:hypothetical protein DF16_pBMB400orf00206 [Bacillus thuringiensis serovar kurstaki str. YBT-1520]